MSSKNTLQVSLDLVLGNASSTIKNVQGLLDSLNISKLDGQFNKNFSSNMSKQLTALQTESEKLKTSLETSLNGKVDEKGISSAITKMISLYGQLENEVTKIASLPQVDMERLIKLNPSLAAEITNIEAKVKELQNTIRQQSKAGLTTALQELSQAGQSFTKGSSPDKHVKELGQQLQSGQINITQYAQSLQELQAKYAAYIETSKKAAQNAGTEWDKSGNIRKNAQAFEALTAAVQKSVEPIEQVQQEVNNLESDKAKKLGQAYEEVSTKAQNAEQGVKEASQSVKEYGTNATSAAHAQNEFISELDEVKSRVKYFFSLTNSIQLFKNAIRDAFETVKELDAAMTETAVVTDFSVGDMWDALPQYTKLAESLGATTLGAYKTMTLYYQQGLKTNEAMQLGTETMKMARIAGMDYATATNLMTSALRGFNMELNTTSAQRVNDVYSELAATTASDTEGIATAMSKTASIANSANMELETTSALLSQIIETTQEAPETAGTAMKTIIARFSEVKKLYNQGSFTGVDGEGEAIEVNKVAAALKTAGINMNKFFSGSVGLDDIFLELAEKWDSLDITQQRYIATQAAGSRQQSRFIAMMSDYDRTMELVNAAYNSGGASAEQFVKTQDSLQSKLNKLSDEWERFTMGLANSTVIKGAVDLLTVLLSTINNLTECFDDGKGIISGILKFTAALGAIKLGKTLLNGGLTGVIGNLSNSFNKMDTSGIANAGDNAGKTFGTSFVTSLNKKISNNSIFGKANTSLTSGVNDWYQKQLGKLNTSKFIKNTFKDQKRANTLELTNALSSQFSVKTLGGKFGQNLSTELQRQLTPQIQDSFKEVGMDISDDTTTSLFSGFNTALNSGNLSGGMAELRNNLYNKFFQQGKKNAGLTDVEAGQFANTEVENLFSKMNTDLGELEKNVAPAAAVSFKGVQDALSGISAVGTGAAIAIGLVSNKLRETGNEKAADVLDGISSGLMIISTLAGVAATAMQVFASGALSALIPLLPVILAIGAAIAVVAVTIKGIEVANIDVVANSLEELSEATKKATEEAEQAQEAYEELGSSKNDYNDKVEALDGLIKGTIAYKDALLEANQAALAMAEEHELSYTIDADGLFVVDQAQLEQKMQEALEHSAKALQIKSALMQDEQNVKNVFSDDEFTDNFTDDLAANVGAAINDGLLNHFDYSNVGIFDNYGYITGNWFKDNLGSSNWAAAGNQIINTGLDILSATTFAPLEQISSLFNDGKGIIEEWREKTQGNQVVEHTISMPNLAAGLKQAIREGVINSFEVTDEDKLRSIISDNLGTVSDDPAIEGILQTISDNVSDIYNNIDSIDGSATENLVKQLIADDKILSKANAGDQKSLASLGSSSAIQTMIKGKVNSQLSDKTATDLGKKYAEIYGYDFISAGEKSIKVADKTNKNETLEINMDTVSDVVSHAMENEELTKALQDLLPLVSTVNSNLEKNAGVSDVLGAIEKGDTSLDNDFLKTIKGLAENDTDKLAEMLGIDITQLDKLSSSMGYSTSQELLAHYQDMASNIIKAQEKRDAELFARFTGDDDLSKMSLEQYQSGLESFKDTLNKFTDSQKTFLQDNAQSLAENFSPEVSTKFLQRVLDQKTLSGLKDTQISAYIGDIQKALGDLSYTNPIQLAKELAVENQQAVRNLEGLGSNIDISKMTAAQRAAQAIKDTTEDLMKENSVDKQLQYWFQSEEFSDIEKNKMNKLWKDRKIDTSEVEELASEYDQLNDFLENNQISTQTLASIMTAFLNKSISDLSALNKGFIDLVNSANGAQAAINSALDFTTNFDPGIDEGEVDDWLKSVKDKVDEFIANGEVGNSQLSNYLSALFTDYTDNVEKYGLRKAQLIAQKKLNTGSTDNFKGAWLDVANNNTGDYQAAMQKRGWTIRNNSKGGIDIEGNGSTKELNQALQDVYQVTEDYANLMITSAINYDETLKKRLAENDFSQGLKDYQQSKKAQTNKGDVAVYSDKEIKALSATTGMSELEIWKKIAKQENVSIEGLKTKEAIIEKINNSHNAYVAQLYDENNHLKTGAALQQELNNIYQKKGQQNWLSSFEGNGKLELEDVENSLNNLGLSESERQAAIQEAVDNMKPINGEVTYKGVKIKWEDLQNDAAAAMQKALDSLQAKQLGDTITSSIVEGFMTAQELIQSGATAEQGQQIMDAKKTLQENGSSISATQVSAILNQFDEDERVGVKFDVEDDTLVTATNAAETMQVVLDTISGKAYKIELTGNNSIVMLGDEVDGLEQALITINGETYKVSVGEKESNGVQTLTDNTGKLKGVLTNIDGVDYVYEVNDKDSTIRCGEEASNLIGKTITLNGSTYTFEVNDQDSTNKCQGKVDKLQGTKIDSKSFTISADTSEAESALSKLTDKLKRFWRWLKGDRESDDVDGYFAKGTTRAGVPRNETALVGEEGPELVETNDGKAHLVGMHGPEITKLKKGDIVHNAYDTERILKGRPTKQMPAHKEGTFTAHAYEYAPSGNSSSNSSSSGSSGSSSSSESPYQKWKGVYDTQLSNDVISIDWYINRLNNMAKTLSMTKEEQYELNKAIRDARYDKASALADQGALTYQQYANQLEAVYSSYPKKGVEGAKKLRQEIRDLWKDYADSSYDLGTFSPEWYLQVLQKQQNWYKKGSKMWRDYEATIISVKNELLDMKFNSGEIGMWSYIENLKKLQKQYAATSKQARELSKTIREQKIAYAEASQKHGLWSIDYEITYLKENLADMKEGTEEYRDALDQIRELQLSNAENKYNRGQWSYERYMQFLKDYQAENQFPATTEQYQEIMTKQTELEIDHINELLDKYNQLNNQLGDIDTGRERAQEIININNELADTHDRLVDIKYALDNQVLTEAQRKAFEEEYNELLVRQVQLLDKAKSKQEEYTDIMKEGLEAQKKLMSDGWGKDDPRKAAQLGLMSVQYAENDRYLAQQQKKTAMNNMQAALIEPQVTLTQKYVSEVNAKRTNGEYADDLAYTNALAEAMAKGLMNAPTNVLPYARVDETSGMVTINQSALDTLKVTNPEEYRKVSEVITIMQGYSEDWMEGNIAEVEATELLEELTDNQKYIDLINRVADDLKQIDQNAIDELEDQKDAIDDIADSVASIIEKVREAVDKIRQQRDNENTRQDLMDKQQKLAYLRQDSTGNALEIKQLEKELADESQSYTDTLIDQKINELEEQNQETQDELQELIDLKREEMERKEKEGTYYEQAQKVVDEFIANDLDDVAANTKDIRDTYLGQIIKEGEKLDTSMSKPEQEKTWTEVKKEAEDAGVSKELHDTAEKANLTKETASEVAKSFGETAKDIAQATGKIASAFAPALDYAINGIADAIKKDKENKSYTDDALKGQETVKPSGAASSSGDKKDNTTTTTPAKPATSTPTPTPSKPAASTTTKPTSTQGDGKIQKGDNVTFTTGKYYNDSYGTAPSGYWHRGEKNAVYVTSINTAKGATHPYHISTGKKLGSGDLGWVKKEQLTGYKTGGMVDFTGPAWLDGTRSKPESVLSAADTQNLLNLTDVLGNLRKNTAKGTTQTNISNDINIEVKVDRVDSDIDINRLADTIGDKVKKSIYKDMKGFQNTRLTHR